MRRMEATALAVAMVVGAVMTRGFAQEVQLRNDANFPLQILSVSPDVGDGGRTYNGARVSMRNTGNVACVAFAVSVVLTLSNSQTRRESIREDHAALGYAQPDPRAIGAGQVYEAGNVVRSRLPIPAGATIDHIEARVDYIEMADSKTYGPDPDDLRKELRSRRFGTKAERTRLRKLYQEQGFSVLLNELMRQ